MVVDTNGRFRLVPNGDTLCRVGNTVEGSDSGGVVRVLSEDPVRYLDFQDFDDRVVDRFLHAGDDVTFEDFGGLEEVKMRARELIETPLRNLDAWKRIGSRPIKGVLFTGPPGTGKTMLARIIASEAGVNFYEISGPEIVSKWFGESEKLLRAIFERAGQESDGSIVFFDEIDSIAAQRSDDAHEASKRIVAQLLTLMDGFEAANNNTIVIAATNRPQDIDAALLRPGRFDAEIEFPLPNQKDREAILRASAKHIAVDGELPHADVAAATSSWSGADLSAIWREATLLAIADQRDRIMAEDFVSGFDRVRARREASKAQREKAAQ
jgi:transitional endoplasmic reticulum ATPase